MNQRKFGLFYGIPVKPSDKPMSRQLCLILQLFQSVDGANGERNDSAFASVDIADFASLEENDKRSPTPEPTISREAAQNHRQSPPKVRLISTVIENVCI